MYEHTSYHFLLADYCKSSLSRQWVITMQLSKGPLHKDCIAVMNS